MEPTLLNGDRVVVAKFMYGLFLPFRDHADITWGAPHLGDVVIIKSPADGVDIVKRVIGVGGDFIEMHDDIVYRNGKPLPRDDKGRCLTGTGSANPRCHWYASHVGDEDFLTSSSRLSFDPLPCTCRKATSTCSAITATAATTAATPRSAPSRSTASKAAPSASTGRAAKKACAGPECSTTCSEGVRAGQAVAHLRGRCASLRAARCSPKASGRWIRGQRSSAGSPTRSGRSSRTRPSAWRWSTRARTRSACRRSDSRRSTARSTRIRGASAERAFLPDDVAAQRATRARRCARTSRAGRSASFAVVALSVAYELELAG